MIEKKVDFLTASSDFCLILVHMFHCTVNVLNVSDAWVRT